MAQSSPLINKNITSQDTHKYIHTSMVSHRGIPVSFAMRNDGKIFYSVLDMSNRQQNAKATADEDKNNDKNYWSNVNFKEPGTSQVPFPNEIVQIGYGVVPNFKIDKYDEKNNKIIHSKDEDGKSFDENKKELSDEAIAQKTDLYFSSTARLGAKAPFQAFSDGKYIYIFRQSLAGDDPLNVFSGKDPIVNNTLLVDRFILSGTVLKLSREIRYQRSQHKTEPESRKDTLAPVDMDGKPFYEPTRELVFANNLSNGNFTVLLIPGADSEEQRWQIFTADSITNRINSFNIRFDYSIVFDTSDSQLVVDEFLDKNKLDNSLIPEIQGKISAGNKDDDIANDLLNNHFSQSSEGEKEKLKDELEEVAYIVRTGVNKDDFKLEAASEWPLMEYESDGKSIKSASDDGKIKYTDNNVLLAKYQFLPELKPQSSPYGIKNGLSSCYYYQQEMGADKKPMKNKACVMLAMGLTKHLDDEVNEYIGIFNFSVAASGHLSRLTTDAVNMPEINMQELDENYYKNLVALRDHGKMPDSEKMGLLDIDSNGLSTTGGVLKFAYTSAAIGQSQGASDAVGATAPLLFDDSLGRVNLYFKGVNNNFFVLYFNPSGSKGTEIKDSQNKEASPPLSLKSRLDCDMDVHVKATLPSAINTCSLTVTSRKEEEVEHWNHLPRRLSQIANILNGKGKLPLGALEPLGNDRNDPRVAYKSSEGKISIRTTVDNNLIFQTNNVYSKEIADGETHRIGLSILSTYLNNNFKLRIAKKSFSLRKNIKVAIKADWFHKGYLSGVVTNSNDIDTLWEKLTKDLDLIDKKGYLTTKALTGDHQSLIEIFEYDTIKSWALELLKEGNSADIKARMASLRQSLIKLILDVAKIRIVTFSLLDENTQKVDRLGAGLAVSVVYNYGDNFNCDPGKLGKISSNKWDHHRSYLFNAEVKYNEDTTKVTEINNTFDYTYSTNNSIGAWEDWDASLALEMNGAVLCTTDRLERLKPSKKGLSVEAWVKPSSVTKGLQNIIYYKKDDQHYSLGIEKVKSGEYNCVATLEDKKYTTKAPFKSNDQWRHLAFTHKKYWGYQLDNAKTINCGNDNSLNLTGDFTLEALVQLNAAGTLIEKKGEYSLRINDENKVVFKWGEEIFGSDKVIKLNEFSKITLIRSRNKPQTKPSKADFPITGVDQKGGDQKEKWYKGKSGDDLTKGLAEKQDQMETKMDLSTQNMFNNVAGQSSEEEVNPEYYHTIIITNKDGESAEWRSDAQNINNIETFDDFYIGGNNFSGVFDNVRIWNRALSIEEAKVLPLPKNKAGLLSHWQMTEGKDKYLYDNVGENHGTGNGQWTDSPRTGQAGQFQFYVDGAPIGHKAEQCDIHGVAEQFNLGGKKSGESLSNTFNGTLEEVRIWNTPRTNEQITDNAFGRLTGEREQLLANYTFDRPINENKVLDASMNSIELSVSGEIKEVLSSAPVATEIPQVRSALTGVKTEYIGDIISRPGVVEYGDVQKNDDGTLNGILKRCYSFIDANGKWHRMTGYKVGNLVSQWYGQAQFAPQVMGYLEGPPPVPGENFPIVEGGPDANLYAFRLNNSINFHQAEEISYNYSTSKEKGWEVGVEGEGEQGFDLDQRVLIAPLGVGISLRLKAEGAIKGESEWKTTGNSSESHERGTSVNTDREFSATLAGYDNGESGNKRYYKLGNTGYALVKSKTADIYLLRLAHNNALVSISWQPNPDIPEDVNIIPFPINPLYTKQGTLDGKFGDGTDDHYPQAHGAYGQYSYFKPREAYKLKKKIDREKMELKAFFEDSFDVSKTSTAYTAAAAGTGIAQLINLIPGSGPILASVLNQTAGRAATELGYSNTKLKEDLAKMGSQRNLVNTYVWTIEGGFYAESTEVAETQQETFSGEHSLSMGGAMGLELEIDSGVVLDGNTMFSSGSSLTLTKTKTKESSKSFGLDVSVDLPTSPRYKYAGTDGRTLTNKGLIPAGIVDAYRFMSFYLEPKGKNFTDLFSKVIDPIWLDESPDPNAQALRQAAGNIDKAKPCWRIMHRVTYVSRVLPEFQPEAPPSLEKSMRVKGIESNYMLIKKFEPYVKDKSSREDFYKAIDEVINAQLPEFKMYDLQIKNYLALYFNMD